ncbi:MAG: helix-turn-helix domain-containing protein [Rhizobiales bacterium]|nr:helix-turn-helix domain-containing protein [Hyphomicrobiales bacterium]
MDKRDIAAVFRVRLRELMARMQLTQARLAAAAHVDRSALAQVLSDASPRLPRAETLINIAHSQGVSLDWLLGLRDEDALATEVSESVEIEEGVRGADDSRLEAWRKEVAGAKIRYVPSRLPDLLMLPEVTAFEHGRRSGPSTEIKVEHTEQALDYSRRPETDMEICMPRERLFGLKRGEDIWRELPETLRARQLAHMARLVDELYPTVRLYLYDGREVYSAPYTVFGQQRAALYMGDIYVVLTARPTVERLSRHFDQLIRRATVASHEASRFIANL